MSQQEGSEGTSGSPGRSLFLLIFLACLGLTVVLILLSFPAGVYAVFSGGLSTKYSVWNLIRPYVWIGPVPAFVPVGILAGPWFIGLLVVYAAFLVYSTLQSRRAWIAITESFRTGVAELFSSPLIVTITAIGFLIFTTSAVDAAISPFLPIGTISGDAFEVFLGLTYPPLVEEFGFRVLLIGAVALILSLGRPTRSALNALWRPSVVFEGMAVGGGASIIIWAAAGLSAVTFGACHVFCGGNNTWQIGKFPEAFYGGIVLAYLYVKYGFHVAVLTHWGVDYLGSVFSFYGQAAYGIPALSGSKEFIGQTLVDYDMLLLFGLVSFLLVLYVGIRKFVRSRQPEAQFNVPLGGGPVQ